MSEPARVSDRPRATPRVSDELVNALVTEGIREGALSDDEAGKFVVALLADLRDARAANVELAELVEWDSVTLEDPGDAVCGYSCTPNGCHECHPAGPVVLVAVRRFDTAAEAERARAALGRYSGGK